MSIFSSAASKQAAAVRRAKLHVFFTQPETVGRVLSQAVSQTITGNAPGRAGINIVDKGRKATFGRAVAAPIAALAGPFAGTVGGLASTFTGGQDSTVGRAIASHPELTTAALAALVFAPGAVATAVGRTAQGAEAGVGRVIQGAEDRPRKRRKAKKRKTPRRKRGRRHR